MRRPPQRATCRSSNTGVTTHAGGLAGTLGATAGPSRGSTPLVLVRAEGCSDLRSPPRDYRSGAEVRRPPQHATCCSSNAGVTTRAGGFAEVLGATAGLSRGSIPLVLVRAEGCSGLRSPLRDYAGTARRRGDRHSTQLAVAATQG